MSRFCVNTNYDHEVHNLDASPPCGHLPNQANRLSLGEHQNCSTAVQKAQRTYSSANGCFYCATACHTS